MATKRNLLSDREGLVITNSVVTFFIDLIIPNKQFTELIKSSLKLIQLTKYIGSKIPLFKQ